MKIYINILNIVDDVECTEDISNYFILKQNNILQRCNKDTGRVNKYGTKILDFCTGALYKFIFIKVSLFLYYFIATCSCQYSYNVSTLYRY